MIKKEKRGKNFHNLLKKQHNIGVWEFNKNEFIYQYYFLKKLFILLYVTVFFIYGWSQIDFESINLSNLNMSLIKEN